MKKIFFILFPSTSFSYVSFSLFPFSVFAQGYWTQKADMTSTILAGRYMAVGFSIGNKGYVGTGQLPLCGPLSDFWEYDPGTDTWDQKANYKGFGFCAGYGTWNAVGFSIGSKGYIGTGECTWWPSNYAVMKDFWEYDPNGIIGIDEEKNNLSLIIFPNPFSTKTIISFSNLNYKIQDLEVKICDLLGKKVKTDMIYNPNSIIIYRNKLETGIYMLIISNKKEILSTEKIIVID